MDIAFLFIISAFSPSNYGICRFVKFVFRCRYVFCSIIVKEIQLYNLPFFLNTVRYSAHPFYTGKSKLVDTAGRVDKFMSRYAKTRK